MNDGRIEATKGRQVYEAAGDIKPKNISIDTLSLGVHTSVRGAWL